MLINYNGWMNRNILCITVKSIVTPNHKISCIKKDEEIAKFLFFYHFINVSFSSLSQSQSFYLMLFSSVAKIVALVAISSQVVLAAPASGTTTSVNKHHHKTATKSVNHYQHYRTPKGFYHQKYTPKIVKQHNVTTKSTHHHKATKSVHHKPITTTTTAYHSAPPTNNVSHKVPAPTSAAQTGASSDIEQQALTSHNAYRAKHHVAGLRWSQKLADHATQVSATCIWGHSVVSYKFSL
jgi:hypothetical protein